MTNNKNEFYYQQEIVALIKSGVEPTKAKEIADAHLSAGNYEKMREQVAKERDMAKKNNEREK